MRHLYSKIGDAFVVVFAVDDPISLEEAKEIIKEVKVRNNKKAPILLVANKIDLYEREEQWAAKGSRIYAFKNKLHFTTLSAINLPQVTETFRRILSEIGNFHPARMKKRRQSMPTTRGSSYSDIEIKAIELVARKHAADKKRLVWRELLIFLILYYIIRLFYNYALPLLDEENPEKYRFEFERISMAFDQYTKLIPLTFLLGFYVSNVVIRWWRQFECIPWPEDLLSLLCTLMPGKDITSQQRRHTIARYLNLTAALVYREISSTIRRRFPSLSHIVESGLLTETELKLLNETSREIKNVRWMIPLHWVQQIVMDESNDNAPPQSLVNQFMQELRAYRTAFRKLFSYDWVCVPLVYTQVAALATYAYFGFCLIGRQYLDPRKKYRDHEVDLMIPIFTIVQFLFFVGWFKVGQDLMRPFGMDDDDFELDYIFERNVGISFAIVDRLQMNDYEPLQKDKFWVSDDSVTISMPRTGLASQHKHRKPMRHIPSYKPVGSHDTEEGKTRCSAWKKRWNGYE
uniref:Bestrophin homolog n=1 Tax=Elaeophora elaphi TaxID=1147741 RepID=A0A0R3RK64_9BILA